MSLAIVILVFSCACGGSAPLPAAPTPAPTPTLAGTWTGVSGDTTGQESMTWTLAQNGSAVSGTMSISDTKRTMMGTGSMQGTVNGTSVTFHMAVPSGGFAGAMSPCSMALDGQAQMSADGRTLTGTYSGSMSGTMSGMMSQTQPCGGPMNGGQFTLTR